MLTKFKYSNILKKSLGKNLNLFKDAKGQLIITTNSINFSQNQKQKELIKKPQQLNQDQINKLKKENFQQIKDEHTQKKLEKQEKNNEPEELKADSGKYNPFQDTTLIKSLKQIFVYFGIIVSSGYFVKASMDKLYSEGSSEIVDKNFDNKMRLNKKKIGEGLYKSEDEIINEFNSLKFVNPNQLLDNKFFQKDKSFFIQIVPDQEIVGDKIENEMHPHYYWLKKIVRQHHRQNLFQYKLNAKDFYDNEKLIQEVLNQKFGIQNYQELNDTFYIIINQDKMKLPVSGRLSGDQISFHIPQKFVLNPIRISSKEDLFELLEVNRESAKKYFFILNKNNQINPGKDMNIEQKMFRKFFYENSRFIEDDSVFAEITDPQIANEYLGIQQENEIVVAINKNSLQQFQNDYGKSQIYERKIFNLELQLLKLEKFDLSQFEGEYIYQTLFSKKNEEDNLNSHSFETWCNSNQNVFEKVFCEISSFIEFLMTKSSNKIYMHSNKLLQFYKRHFRDRQNEGLIFISVQFKDDYDLEKKQQFFNRFNDQLNEVCETYKRMNVQILFTDLKDAPERFSLLSDSIAQDNNIEQENESDIFQNDEKDNVILTIRFIDYSRLYDKKTDQIYSIQEMGNMQEFENASDERIQYLFPLKYKPHEKITKISDLQDFIEACYSRDLIQKNKNLLPYLESKSLVKSDETVQEVNSQSLNEFVNKQQYSIIEVFQNGCTGCEDVNPLLPELRQRLQNKFGVNKIDICKIHILNENVMLKDVDFTPSFLLFDKKDNKIKKIKIEKGNIDENQQMVDVIFKSIENSLKN